MRLTLSLLKKVMPRGNIFTGRHRLEYKPDARARDLLRTAIQIEEQNMLYLRNPFLTVEQSCGHAKELKKREKYIEEHRARRKEWWKPIKYEDKLNHLRHGEAWDV